MIPLAGAVLAGGKASRFGSDKTRLPHRGLSLSSYLLKQMGQAGLGPLALSAPSAPADLPPGVQLIQDREAGLGPLGGLWSVLEELQAPVLVAGGDMPGLDAPAFEALAKAWKPGQGGLVAASSRGLEPLFAIYEPGLLPRLRQAVESRNLALYRLIQAWALPSFFVPHEQWLLNINEPTDRVFLSPEDGTK